MHPFRQFIHTYTLTSEQDWALIANCLTRRVLSKGYLLLEEGKIFLGNSSAVLKSD